MNEKTLQPTGWNKNVKTPHTERRHLFTLPVGTELTPQILKKFMEIHKEDIKQFNRLESYLDGDLPEMERIAPNPLLVVNDFAGYITTLSSSYLVGEPVQYQASKNVDISAITDAYLQQSISDLDSELAEDCSIYGKAYEMIYADEDANILSAKLDVRNTIVIRDNTFRHDMMYAVYFMPVLDENGEIVQDVFDVTVLDEVNTAKYRIKGESWEELQSPTPHEMGTVPVVEYVNNRRFRGDFEAVIALIDAYNILQSDRVIDREALVDAILAFEGVDMDEETMKEVKEHRVIGLPPDSRAEYIIKNINEADADVLRKTIASDIHKFAMVPDMSDEKFAGNSTGVALGYKLLPFEERTQRKERYFERGLRQRFIIYNNFLHLKNKMETVTISEVDVIFTRGLPKNDLEMSQIAANYAGLGLVSKTTQSAQISYVRDAEEEVRLAAEEDEKELQRGAGNYGTNDPNEANEDGKPKSNESLDDLE